MMCKLTQGQCQEIADEHKSIPSDYLRWMLEIGWGEHENGYMIYEGPTMGSELVPSIQELEDVLIVADYMVGYKVVKGRYQFVGIESAGWVVDVLPETFTAYMEAHE